MQKILASLILAAALVAVGAAAIALLSNPLNRSALKEDAGYITRGGKFGIDIGSRADLAPLAAVKSGFAIYGRADDKSCLLHRYKNLDVDVYADDSWRKGTLCVAFRKSDNLVTAIEWSYGPFKIEL